MAQIEESRDPRVQMLSIYDGHVVNQEVFYKHIMVLQHIQNSLILVPKVLNFDSPLGACQRRHTVILTIMDSFEHHRICR